ncbi:hypothetical protein [Sutcliffiella horikoshii]|uniref:hypothetical protein n=1 Tax=Sutcliffiella horikoshii TaxID=79883 RepID=UPI001F47C6A7|nr:hypothetical protein [Sutcliffiella horikoshii]
MQAIIDSIKGFFLDIFAMGKGFIYGFMMIGLLIVGGTALLYGALWVRNLFI